jgi:hypothetical protein
MYGEPVPIRTLPSGEFTAVDEPSGARRSIYQMVRRSQMQSFLGVFDAPTMDVNCVQRTRSTSALQALALMNGEFVSEQSRWFARRVLRKAPPNNGADTAAVNYAFRLAFARLPSQGERVNVLEFLERQATFYRDMDQEKRLEQIYTDFCQALLSASEFIYVD